MGKAFILYVKDINMSPFGNKSFKEYCSLVCLFVWLVLTDSYNVVILFLSKCSHLKNTRWN